MTNMILAHADFRFHGPFKLEHTCYIDFLSHKFEIIQILASKYYCPLIKAKILKYITFDNSC